MMTRGASVSPSQSSVSLVGSLWGFPLACSPESRLRHDSNGLLTSVAGADVSFIRDHPTAMDLCNGPEWQYLHGALFLRSL